MSDAPDFSAYRHPVLAVECPDCGARAGSWCKRPSGHRAMNFHKARRKAADRAWEEAGRPEIKPGKRKRSAV